MAVIAVVDLQLSNVGGGGTADKPCMFEMAILESKQGLGLFEFRMMLMGCGILYKCPRIPHAMLLPRSITII